MFLSLQCFNFLLFVFLIAVAGGFEVLIAATRFEVLIAAMGIEVLIVVDVFVV